MGDARQGGLRGLVERWWRERRAAGSAEVAPPTTTQPHERLPGLEGVRAIAVLAVLAYHGEIAGVLPAGFLGVDIFFVLSGFLITALLLREHEAHGAIDLRGFYLRRARRLLPALLAMLTATALVAPWLAPDAVARLREDLPAALFYVSNWWQIASAQSYFEAFNRPPLLQHLWSLAIEEQFYIVWPLLAIALLRASGRRGLALFSLAGALLATGWMAALAIHWAMPEERDASRLYFGSDTHCMGLLVGAALAALIDPWRRPAVAGPARAARGRALDALGGVALLGLLAIMALGHDTQPWLYRGGFLLVSVLTALLLLAAVQPASWLQPVLASAPMRWIGERSYGLYIWHWPVFVMLRPRLELPADPWLAFALRLAVTVAIAELSYRWVEVPVRRGQFLTAVRRPWLALGAATAAAFIVSTAVLLLAPRATDPTGNLAAAAAGGAPFLGEFAGKIEAPERSAVEADTIAAVAAASTAARAAGRIRPAPAVVAAPALAQASGEGLPRVTAFGDSVLLGARDALLRKLPGAEIDAEVGRQASRGLTRVREVKAQERLGNVVLLHIGSNGFLAEPQLRAALAELADRERVLLVTVRVPKRWEAHNNDILERASREFPNTVLVDWARLSADHPEYFVADGVHLSSAGIRRFTEEIRRLARGPAGGGEREAPSSSPTPSAERAALVPEHSGPTTPAAEPSPLARASL
ncbi:MAG: acyltransferase family protein [Betaproteobacteria bacterium]